MSLLLLVREVAATFLQPHINCILSTNTTAHNLYAFSITYIFPSDASQAEGIKVDKSIEFSYEELFNAAQGFSTDHKIGQGGFGSVYRVFVCLIKGLIEVNKWNEALQLCYGICHEGVKWQGNKSFDGG